MTATPLPDAPDAGTDPFLDRVTDLLLRLERGDPRRLVLRPIADMRPIGGDLLVFATVHVDAGDDQGSKPYALQEVLTAAICLREDPPFPAAPCAAPRLVEAVETATAAALRLTNSLN